MAFTKPLPIWEAKGTEPPLSLKQKGWQAGVKPPSEYFNYLQNRCYEALKELQEKAGEVKKVNGQAPDNNGNINVNVDTSTLATKQELETHSVDYLQHTGYAVATGSANAYIATLNPALSAYAEGVSLRLKINVANTGASTVNVNGLGAKAIKKQNGNAVTAGNLKVGLVYTLVYDGTSFILQGEGGEDLTELISLVNEAELNNDDIKTDVIDALNAKVSAGLSLSSLWSAVTTKINSIVNRGSVGTQQLVIQNSSYTIPAGYHNGQGIVQAVISNLSPENIKKGTAVGGVVGTFDAPAAVGVVTVTTPGGANKTTVTGLGFFPTKVYVLKLDDTNPTTWHVVYLSRLKYSMVRYGATYYAGNSDQYFNIADGSFTFNASAYAGDYVWIAFK